MHKYCKKATLIISSLMIATTPVLQAFAEETESSEAPTIKYIEPVAPTPEAVAVAEWTPVQQAQYVEWAPITVTSTPSQNTITPQAQAEQEWNADSQARYDAWLASQGKNTSTGVSVVSGAMGQPGSEIIINNVNEFHLDLSSETLLAADPGVIPDGTKLTTTEIDAGTLVYNIAYNSVMKVNPKAQLLKVYDFTATTVYSQKLININGNAAVSIPAPTGLVIPLDKTLQAYIINTDGSLTSCECLIDSGRVVIGIISFGTYALVIE